MVQNNCISSSYILSSSSYLFSSSFLFLFFIKFKSSYLNTNYNTQTNNLISKWEVGYSCPVGCVVACCHVFSHRGYCVYGPIQSAWVYGVLCHLIRIVMPFSISLSFYSKWLSVLLWTHLSGYLFNGKVLLHKYIDKVCVT